jgi:hypothetical protein
LWLLVVRDPHLRRRIDAKAYILPGVWCKGGVKGLADERTGNKVAEFQILGDSESDFR